MYLPKSKTPQRAHKKITPSEMDISFLWQKSATFIFILELGKMMKSLNPCPVPLGLLLMK